MNTKDSDIHIILQQAPEGIELTDVETLYEKHKGNSSDILTELWNIPKPPVKNKSCKENKWNEIRDICDSLHEEYDKLMMNARQQLHKLEQ